VTSDRTTRFGRIVFAGQPNAGKSTLLNAILGMKLAIVSPRPQTTRHPVVGVLTEGDVQLEFVDPAGLLSPKYLLQAAMLREAIAALETADGIVHLHPADLGPVPALETLLPPDVRIRAPVIVVRTKGDLEGGSDDAPAKDGTLVVSARTDAGLPALLDWCRERARPGPWRHDPEAVSSLPVRFFVAEFVREAALRVLEQEVPYALAVDVDEFREDRDPVYIRAAVFVERASQKGIVIGHEGSTIKRIGQAARRASEEMLGQRVYLDLRVKVLPKWRKAPHHLRRMGFSDVPQE
jgi:GTP-binding protein Era